MSQILTTGPLDILTIIALSGLAESTKIKYQRAVSAYLATGAELTDTAALGEFALTCSNSRRANLKSALRLWFKAAKSRAKAQANSSLSGVELLERVAKIQAVLWQIEAMSDAIKTEAHKGVKAHTWLTQAEVKRLLATCGKTTGGQRDKVVLGLLVGAGLRRDEAINLAFADVVLQPIAGKFRTVLNVSGKGAKDRIVPIRDLLAVALDAWRIEAGPGRVARAITKAGVIGDSLSEIGVFRIVRAAGDVIGKAGLDPHDLRRSFAQLGFEAGVPITQISRLLGHASMATTQRYLNLDLDLESTVSDYIPFE